MKQLRIFLLVAFINATVISFIAVRVVAAADGRSDSSSEEADRIAIERLHRQDVEATLSDKADELAKLWDSEAVRIQPGRPAEIGKAKIYANDNTGKRSPIGRGRFATNRRSRMSKSPAIGRLNGATCLIRTPAILSRCEAKC